MSSGRLFQSFGPAEAYERSPTVTRRDGRTSSWLEVADRRRRRDGKSATRRRRSDRYRSRCSAVQSSVYKDRQFEIDALRRSHVTDWPNSNELSSAQRQKKTRQTKEHKTFYFQGGPQEHEPVMGFCTDHRTGQNGVEDSCCPMCGNTQQEDLSLSLCLLSSSRGAVVKLMDLNPANPGSTAAG